MKIIPFSQFTDGDTEGQKARGSYLDCGEKLSRPGLRGGSGGKNEKEQLQTAYKVGYAANTARQHSGGGHGP